ncbi:hypothetical protein PMAYCL1PPCAC_30606, partial [Pristionchus mayeri]
SCRVEQKKLGIYRWFITSIVVVGLLWDVHVSMLTAPFPLLPHISFWADGLLVYIHHRIVVYLLAFALFLIYLWLTTLLLAFLYRFYAIAEGDKKKVIQYVGYLVVIMCIFNTFVSCGILILKYPDDDKILTFLTKNNNDMLFLYHKPAFIYFIKFDNFIYAQIGMAHVLSAVIFYIFVFLYVLISIHLV